MMLLALGFFKWLGLAALAAWAVLGALFGAWWP